MGQDFSAFWVLRDSFSLPLIGVIQCFAILVWLGNHFGFLCIASAIGLVTTSDRRRMRSRSPFERGIVKMMLQEHLLQSPTSIAGFSMTHHHPLFEPQNLLIVRTSSPIAPPQKPLSLRSPSIPLPKRRRQHITHRRSSDHSPSRAPKSSHRELPPAGDKSTRASSHRGSKTASDKLRHRSPSPTKGSKALDTLASIRASSHRGSRPASVKHRHRFRSPTVG